MQVMTDEQYYKAKEWYLLGVSTLEIAEHMKLPVGVRSLQRRLKKDGVIRTVRQSYHIAIAKGRMVHANRRKPKLTTNLTQ